MAYVLRYYNDIATSQYFKKAVRFEILERDYAGSSSEIKMSGTVSISKAGDDRSEPIKKKTCNLSILSETNFQFIDLFTSDDRKYQVKVFYDAELVFIGFLESDSYEEPYAFYTNYEINLTARDNLGRLNDIDYLDGSGDKFDGLDTAKNILTYVLDKTGYTINIPDNVRIYAVGMTEVFNTFPQAYLNRSGFWNYDDNKPISCLEVLTRILSGFGAQIRQLPEDGWKIEEQAKYYLRPSVNVDALMPRFLQNEIVFPIIPNETYWLDQSARLALQPAWKKFTLNQDALVPTSFFDKFPNSKEDYIFVGPEGNRYSLVDWNMNGYNVNFQSNFTRLYIDPIGVVGWNIDTDKAIKQTSLNLAIKIKYQNGSSFYYGTPVTESPVIDVRITDGAQTQILTTSGWVPYVAQSKELRFSDIVLNSGSDTEVTVITDGIPFDGDLKIIIHYEISQVFSISDITYSFRPGELKTTIDASIDENNNLIGDTDDLYIGEVPVEENSILTYYGGIFNSSGVAYADWHRIGDTTDRELLKVIAEGYDLLNNRVSRQITGSLFWGWDLWTNIKDQGRTFMLNSGTWDLVNDRLDNAEWIEVFEYDNTLGAYDLGFDDGFDNNTTEDYNTNTIFTITEKYD